MNKHKVKILTGQLGNLIPLDGVWVARSSDKSFGGDHDVDDPKFPGDARNSRNHYTTALMVTNSCTHELASPRRLALANANEDTSKNEEETLSRMYS